MPMRQGCGPRATQCGPHCMAYAVLPTYDEQQERQAGEPSPGSHDAARKLVPARVPLSSGTLG
jgi:hypothetical protein